MEFPSMEFLVSGLVSQKDKVSDLLGQLTSIAAREAGQEKRLVVGVEGEVLRLQDNLRILLEGLDNAEGRRESDEDLGLWLDKIRKLCYDMEILLADWNTAINKSESLWGKMNRRPSTQPIVLKIQELSQILDDICQERVLYIIERPKTTSFIDVPDSNEYVREEVVNDLVKLLLGTGSPEEKRPQVFSLVGMGGIGKTTVAQLAFNNDFVIGHFDKRIWVCVTDLFNQIQVAKTIITCLQGFCLDINNLQELLEKILHLIRGIKFFIVLDDVWIEDSTIWEPFMIALQDCAPGSKILVTTRKLRVALIMGSATVINLELLCDDACLSMLRKIAFFDMGLEQRQQLEDLAQELAKKCKGLPLAAKFLGSLMRSKRSKEQWENLLHSSYWELKDVEKDLFAPFLTSYYELPLEKRRCFLYCAVFPKDKVILVNDLIQLWIAQNYINAKGNEEKEIVGEEYIDCLAMRSFFQDLEIDKDVGRIISCKMHDVMHEFAVSRTKKVCFPMVVDGNKSEIAPIHNTRHLSLTFARKAQFPESIYVAKELRTLLTSNSRHAGINFILPNLCQHLTYLESLNLSDSSIEKLPNEIGNLVHLRYLDLSSNYDIEELPETLCNLCNLQSLDISRCYILEKLPQGMGELINLRHLILEGCNFMKMFPKGIGRLSTLRTLTKFIVSGNNQSEGCNLGELENLNYLEGALEIKGLGNVIDMSEAVNAQLGKKMRLCCLYLGFDKEGEENGRMENDLLLLNALKPHPYLEDLQIHSYQGATYPNWMMSLTRLKVLKLTNCNYLQHLSPLSKLPLLRSLEILNAHSLKKVGVEFLGIESSNKNNEVDLLFPRLISLTFFGLKELEEWDGNVEIREGDGVSIMPRLQILTIRDCPKLKALPDFLKETPIKELRIENCSQISNWEQLLTSFQNLKVLVLKQCKNLEHLPPFGKLQSLESLSLWNVDSVKSVGSEFLERESNSENSFPKLKFLEFWSFREWEKWDGIGGTGEEDKSVIVMPHLHSLIIYNCPMLKSLPHFLQNTPLEELRISGCPFLKQTCQGGNWPKISHTPNIKIND